MVEPLLHIVIPFTALILVGIAQKPSLFISLCAILPDLDVLFDVHRSITHSAIFITFIFIYISIFYKNITILILTYLSVISHVMFDVFHTYTPILYPLVDSSFYIHTELQTDMSNITDLNFIFEILIAETTFGGIPEQSFGAIFTGVGLITFLILLCGIKYKEVMK